MPDRDDLADPSGGPVPEGASSDESGMSVDSPIDEGGTAVDPPLPEAVRQRVVSLAANSLGALNADELPVPLRRVANFAPQRRARLGGALIALHLDADPLFRQRVGTRVRESAGPLGTAIAEGTVPATADPVEVAALAYLCRPAGWADLVAAATEAVRVDAENAAIADRIHTAEQRALRLEHERTVARVEADKLRDELARLREEAAALREEVRTLGRGLRESQAREKRATELLAVEKGRAQRAAADNEAELRRLRTRLADAEDLASGARQAAKEARAVDEARLWLLLETIGQAAVGLRRELALDPATTLPADHVAATMAARPEEGGRASARALEADDPARLDQLLALPRVHLVVDGYNVTKRGFGDLSLEQQRSRLVAALAGIAAQSGAETTVVFDGAEKLNAVPGIPRSLRVLFSRKGETADELIRALVRAEPPGRPVVVISSDREVADGVRRHGAYPLSADTLLRRIARS